MLGSQRFLSLMLFALGSTIVGPLANAVPANAGVATRAFAAPVRYLRPAPPDIPGGVGQSLLSVAPALGPAAQTYAITDIGAPSFAADSVPVAFNDADEIIGFGISPATHAPDCILYNGIGGFLDVSAAPTHLNCQPQSLSARSAKGLVNFVGTLDTPFSAGPIAFEGQASTSAATVASYGGNDPSALYGVNASGMAVGSGYNEPYGADELFSYSTNVTIFVPAKGQAAAVLLQCQSQPFGDLCLQPIQPAAPCAFGGCLINDAGTLLAIDYYDGYYEVQQPTSAYPTDTSIYAYPGGAIMLNNAGTIAYEAYISDTSQKTIVGTKHVAPLPGNSCTSYLLDSLNNVNGAFGYTANCAAAKDRVYWIWDPVHGTRNLNSAIPANTYRSIKPLGMNDNGQILALLVLTNGTLHWGLLNPRGTAAGASPSTLRRNG